MSFSSEVKNELCKVKTPACCRLAECLGLLLFGRVFSLHKILFYSESEAVANRLCTHLEKCFAVTAQPQKAAAVREGYTVTVNNPGSCQKIFKAYGFTPNGVTALPPQILNKDCCVSAFVRGAFLACGSITDPKKEYHAEFCLHKTQPVDLFAVLLGKIGLTPGVAIRSGAVVLYFKGSAQIEDLLTTVRATRFTLELAEIKVYKDIRNHYNRLTNCEAANISKTVGAAVRQREAIAILKKLNLLDGLSPELQEAAALREAFPDASLQELCAKCAAPVTRSGLNHRLNKLVLLAQKSANG